MHLRMYLLLRDVPTAEPPAAGGLGAVGPGQAKRCRTRAQAGAKARRAIAVSVERHRPIPAGRAIVIPDSRDTRSAGRAPTPAPRPDPRATRGARLGRAETVHAGPHQH